MDLVTYLKGKLTGKPYDWYIDASWSDSIYIHYQFGTNEQEDDGYEVRTVIRFSGHNRVPILTDRGVYKQQCLKDCHINNGIKKGYVDAILEYTDNLVLRAIEGLRATENGGSYFGIYWNNKNFDEIHNAKEENDTSYEGILTVNF